MSDDMFQRLAAPFPPEAISWRVGSSNKKKRQKDTGDQYAKATKGQVLAYLDARDVMERFDEVCTPAGWANRYTHADRKTICEIGVRTPDGEWVWKADGAGDSDIEAEKGALSDAFKRAAVRWGVGRYLYDVDSPWVDLDEREQIPADAKRRLAAMLSKGANQNAAKPEPQAPQNNPGVVTAMKAAIDMCDSEPALDAWKDDNKVSFDRLSEDDYREVVAYWREAVRKARAARQSAAA